MPNNRRIYTLPNGRVSALITITQNLPKSAETLDEKAQTDNEMTPAFYDLINPVDEPDNTDNEIAKTNDEPTKTVDEIVNTNDELTKTVDELIKTNDELTKTVDELTKTNDEIVNTIDEIGETNDEQYENV